MSRIGRKPITLPKGVTVEVAKDNTVTVKGPKGSLSRRFDADMSFSLNDDVLTIDRPSDSKRHKALHGLTRALVQNMVTGVSDGFKKELELVGVGYRAVLQGKSLDLSLGFSHPVIIDPPANVSFEVAKGGRSFTIHGIDKEQVGQLAAEIRALRPPEPYKGKGIRYAGEIVRIKAGKSAKK